MQKWGGGGNPPLKFLALCQPQSRPFVSMTIVSLWQSISNKRGHRSYCCCCNYYDGSYYLRGWRARSEVFTAGCTLEVPQEFLKSANAWSHSRPVKSFSLGQDPSSVFQKNFSHDLNMQAVMKSSRLEITRGRCEGNSSSLDLSDCLKWTRLSDPCGGQKTWFVSQFRQFLARFMPGQLFVTSVLSVVGPFFQPCHFHTLFYRPPEWRN